MFAKPVLVSLVATALAVGPALAQERANGETRRASPTAERPQDDLRAAAHLTAVEIVREEATAAVIDEQGSVAEQRRRSEQRRHGLYKVYAGASLAGLGGLLAATSSESVCVNDPFGGKDLCLTARSNGRLYGGLGMVGIGAFLIWNGANDRKNASMSSTPPDNEGLSVTVGLRNSVDYRLAW